MALNALGLGIVLTAKDLASGVMTKVSSAFKDLHEQGTRAAQGMEMSFKAFKMGLGVMGGGLGILAGAFKLAESYGELDDALDAVGARTRATSEDLDMLEDAAIRASFATHFKPAESVHALEVLTKSFGNAEDAAANLEPVLHLASLSMGKLGTAQAAQVAADTLKIYGMEADKTTELVDKLVVAQKQTGLGAEDFSRTFKRAATTGQQFGQSIDETLLSLGLLKGRGLESRQVMQSYNQTLQRLATDTKAQSALQEKHIEAFDKQTGKMRPLTSVLADVVAATKDMTDKDRNAYITKALGAKGMSAYDSVAKATYVTMQDGNRVTLKGVDAVKAMANAMGDAAGQAKALDDAKMDDLGGALEQIASASDGVGKQFGKVLGEIMKPAAIAVRDAIRAIGIALQDNPQLKKFIAIAVIGAGVLITLLGAFMATTAGIAILVLGIKVLGGTMLTVTGYMLPFIALFAIAGAAVYGFYYAVKHNIGGMGTMFDNAFAKVRLAWSALSQLFTQGGFSGKVREEMDKAGNSGVRQFAVTVFLWFNRVKNFLKGVGAGFEAAMATVGPVFDAFGQALTRLGEAFGIVQDGPTTAAGKYAAWGKAGQTVGKMLVTILTGIVQVMTFVINTAIDVGNAINKVANYFGGWDGILTGVKYALVGLTVYMGVMAVEALVAFGGAALAAAGGLGALSFASVIAGAASMLGPVGAATAAFTALYAAVDQAMKLYKEWDENSSTQIMTEIKHDLGLLSDAQYDRALAKRQGIKGGEEASAFTRDKDGNLVDKTESVGRAKVGPAPIGPPLPPGFVPAPAPKPFGPPPPPPAGAPPAPAPPPPSTLPLPAPLPAAAKAPSAGEIGSAVGSAVVAGLARIPIPVVNVAFNVDGEEISKHIAGPGGAPVGH